jgi:hypothetical protein
MAGGNRSPALEKGVSAYMIHKMLQALLQQINETYYLLKQQQWAANRAQLLAEKNARRSKASGRVHRTSVQPSTPLVIKTSTYDPLQTPISVRKKIKTRPTVSNTTPAAKSSDLDWRRLQFVTPRGIG